MKRHSAVLFPDVVPDVQVLFPLVHVFQPLVYCLPVESEPAAPEILPTLPEEYFSRSLCRLVFPAPLGPDRERFLRLIFDLRHRGDDYAAQLANVSLASIGSGGARETESRGAILSNLLRSHGIGQTGADRKSLILWQSRLLLKLGEVYDEKQLALSREMERIREREKGLLEELRRETEHSYTFTEKLFSGSATDEGRQRLRLKAWARIFALGEDPPAGCGIFITVQPDAFDRLAEEYERMQGEQPEKSFTLQLPAVPAGEEISGPEQVRRFAAASEAFLGEEGLLSPGEERCAELPARMGEWERLLDHHYPADVCGRRKLELYRFAGIPTRRLFLGSFSQGDDLALLASDGDEESPDILLGVLSGTGSPR